MLGLSRQNVGVLVCMATGAASIELVLHINGLLDADSFTLIALNCLATCGHYLGLLAIELFNKHVRNA